MKGKIHRHTPMETGRSFSQERLVLVGVDELDQLELTVERMKNCQNCGWWDFLGRRCMYPVKELDCCMFKDKWKPPTERDAV